MNRLQTRMMRMAMLAICSAALTAPLTVLAQDPATPPPPPAGQPGGPGGHGHMSPEDRSAHELQMLTKHLSLTDAQQTQVKQIFADSDAKMKAAHDGAGKGDKKDMREQMKASMEDRQAKVRAVLTADQQKKFDEMVAMRKKRMEEHRGPGGPGGPDGGGNPPPPPPQQ
ncbi:MAG: hypothetical protein P4L10_14665 [Acidobacteriaceae bacterium]|nr:hypothetical protein [Acidobacteriaceae bacterium]